MEILIGDINGWHVHKAPTILESREDETCTRLLRTRKGVTH